MMQAFQQSAAVKGLAPSSLLKEAVGWTLFYLFFVLYGQSDTPTLQAVIDLASAVVKSMLVFHILMMWSEMIEQNAANASKG